MVFFTCNHCGEAVKKPVVDKHYNTKCRGAPKSVSCMDCQKDFQENYVEHTKCISEMQKYSGKDYVPRESQNSGAKKQEGWTEVVRSVLDSEEYKLSQETRQAFLTLQNYDNIPRKKAKFLNFVTNSVHLRRKTVEEVWNILEKEQEKMKQVRQAQQATVVKDQDNLLKEGTSATENVDDGMAKKKEIAVNAKQNGYAEDSKKKKKKIKQKDTANEVEVAVEHNLANGDIELEAAGKKKKKKQKAIEETGTPGETQQNGHGEEGIKLKKKHNVEMETTESNAAEPPSKKQKQNESNEHAGNSAETQPKKKKHKELDENGFGAEEPAKKKQKAAEVNNATQSNSEETYQFCWDTELARLTSKYPDGITLGKLKKKLLKKFKTKFADSELTERQQKGFEKKLNKKLKKSASLQLEGDLVKACS